MHSCTFFGRRNCPSYIEPILKDTIRQLIMIFDVTWFYVGASSEFDKMVLKVLKELQHKHKNIYYWIVLTSSSTERPDMFINESTILPEGIENMPSHLADVYRNNYMLSQSDFVITYTVGSAGSAVKFENLARSQNKTVYNIAKIKGDQNNFTITSEQLGLL